MCYKFNTVRKTALITGINGQDGSYLAEYLLNLDYKVYGTSRTSSIFNNPIDINGSVEVCFLDLQKESSVKKVISIIKPDELYNLAARSSSSQLFDNAILTTDVNAMGVVRILENIKAYSPKTKFFQASSSEVFAGSKITPQNETTPLSPINAYGAAKAFAVNIVKAYREAYSLYAVSGILYNHESPRRSLDYVSKKIAYSVARIALGLDNVISLGSLDARRDWGFAGDYVRAMWAMLKKKNSTDYIIATGVTHSIRDFCEIAFRHVGLNYQDFVTIDQNIQRRCDKVELCGDSSKALRELDFKISLGFSQLVKLMVDFEIQTLKMNYEKCEKNQ